MRLTNRGGRRKLSIARAATRGRVDSGRSESARNEGKGGGAEECMLRIYISRPRRKRNRESRFRCNLTENQGVVGRAIGIGDAEC